MFFHLCIRWFLKAKHLIGEVSAYILDIIVMLLEDFNERSIVKTVQDSTGERSKSEKEILLALLLLSNQSLYNLVELDLILDLEHHLLVFDLVKGFLLLNDDHVISKLY